MLKRGDTSVLVLNGNGIGGAAARTAEQIRGKHYLIAAPETPPSTDFPRSIIMYRPGFKREAQRLAKDFGVRRVGPARRDPHPRSPGRARRAGRSAARPPRELD